MSSSNLDSDSDLRPTGICAFQGDSCFENRSQLHSNSLGSYPIDSPTPSFTDDALKFLEFLSKNDVDIIPREEFILEPEVDHTINNVPKTNSDDHQTHTALRPRREPAPKLNVPDLKGANMQVLRARWKGEPVALKVFKTTSTPTFGSTANDFTHKFREYTNLMQDIYYEIQVMNQWRSPQRHRNIVYLLGLSFEEGIASSDNQPNTTQRYIRPILVTPLAHQSYPDLRYYLQTPDRPRPLPYEECVRLIGDIADGIQGLHHSGVIHADLKPENVLIFPTEKGFEGDLVAKITDFGFSGLKAHDSALNPRGGTRQWNAPECLRSCVDEELLRYSGETTRDIYSFGLMMVHIMLDGRDPLPFHDLDALDELKLQDKARDEALVRLRSYYFEYRASAEPFELERLENVIGETLQLIPGKRRKNLDGIRSCLLGRFVYSRELEIMRMTMGSRFPTLTAMKYTDTFYEVAAAVPAIQAVAKKLPFSFRASISQHYLSQNTAEVPWPTKMRILGLVTQEIRDDSAGNAKTVKKRTFRFPLWGTCQSSPSDAKQTSAEIQAIQQTERQLLKEYTEYRNPERRIRGYLEGAFEDFHGLGEDHVGSDKLSFLQDVKLGMSLDHYLTRGVLPELVLNSKTKRKFGPLHCAAYYDRHFTISQLLCSGLQVDDRASIAGYTALHVAAIRGNTKSIRTLLEGNADCNRLSRGELGCTFTPLALIVLWCRNPKEVLEAMEVLASYGADFAKTMGGRVSLAHMAAGRTTSEILRVILTHAPALLDARDVYNRTPLHVAAEEGRLENVKLLLDLGAKLSARDYQDETPLGLAESAKMRENDEKLVPGINSDFSYRLLRNIRLAVSADESKAVIHHIKKVMNMKNGDFEDQTDLQNSNPPTEQPATKYSGRLKFAVADAVVFPQGGLKPFLPDALPLEDTDGWKRGAHYIVFEPRYGLRFIYHVLNDIPPLDYQLVLRLGRVKHEWNNFLIMLQVFKLPEREILLSHLWRTSRCLPLENTIYTIKFGEFQLFEAANIEISLSTVEIGSEASPSAGLCFNWIAIEPSVAEVPVYGVLESTNVEEWLSNVASEIDVEPVEYDVRDESNSEETARIRNCIEG